MQLYLLWTRIWRNEYFSNFVKLWFQNSRLYICKELVHRLCTLETRFLRFSFHEPTSLDFNACWRRSNEIKDYKSDWIYPDLRTDLSCSPTFKSSGNNYRSNPDIVTSDSMGGTSFQGISITDFLSLERVALNCKYKNASFALFVI